MDANRRALKTWAAATLGILAIEAAAAQAISRAGLPAMSAVGLARAADTVLIFLCLRFFGLARQEIALPRGEFLTGLRKGLLWSAFFGIAAGLGFWAAALIGLDPMRLIRSPAGRLPAAEAMAFWVVGGLIGPVAEELYFRGLLYRVLRPLGAAAAVFGTTALFTLLHPSAGTLPITQIVGGLVFAAAVEKEQNLLVPITIHMLGNSAIFSLAQLI
jgi:uncharacterized protein